MTHLTINGRPVDVPDDATVLQAVRAAGVHLPTLCYWEGLPGYGACRLCLVEVRPQAAGPASAARQRGQVVASCAYPVEEGLTVETGAPAAAALRRLALEFLLARCPSSKVIRELAAAEGVTRSRFGPPEPERADELCILCGLCVRVCRDLVGAAAIGFIGRGTARQVDAPFHIRAEACIGCGACAAVCPTGAVRLEDRGGQRFLYTWHTVIPLQPCPSCGQPFAPEPMAFLRALPETAEHLWGLCPACRRKAAANSQSVGRVLAAHG